MAQPAVVLIARHGPRLDAADNTWHLSTPTPYDPPLTYGGWNQSRSLGVRIASLLHAREQKLNITGEDAQGSNNEEHAKDGGEERPRKRRRVRHKVVIHTSPFLRCLQTSVAIAAGMAQYNPTIETAHQKRPSSASPKLRTSDGPGVPRNLSSIAESKHDFAHAIARKALYEHSHHRKRKAKLRVDAFLGEWLNPQYFEGITAPPPSAMMVTTAKAELLENESVEIFQPTVVTKSSNSSLWAGANGTTNPVAGSSMDDWSPVEEALPPSPTRSRASTASNTGPSESGRKSPFRPGSPLQPLTSTVPKPEPSVYSPPTPHYAVSSSHQIPRGYVVHARNACTDVEYQWDSSRSPLSWGDGGEYGEEWSSMHKRFRRGLNHLIEWYSHHNADDRSEDALGFDQAEKYADEEEHQEDLVVILVTHGAGCNALIGALTGQPVLLDIGMASLTMAVRKEDAPPVTTYASSTLPSGQATPSGDATRPVMSGRRSSLDMGLSSIYEMKIVSSSEHLRPGADPTRASSPSARSDTSSTSARDSLPRFRDKDHDHRAARSNTNASLGTIRRPSSQLLAAIQDGSVRSSSLPRDGLKKPPTPPLSAGLWTPPASRTPALRPHGIGQQGNLDLNLNESDRGRARDAGDAGDDMVLDFSNSPPDSRPTSSGGLISDGKNPSAQVAGSKTDQLDGSADGGESDDDVADMPRPGDRLPDALSRRLSQSGLWGSVPSGAQVERRIQKPKRRWTVEQD